MSGVAATIAAASSDLLRDERRAASVATSTATPKAVVNMRAGVGLPRTTTKVFGSSRRVIVPPGEWFSKNPVPALTGGSTLTRYSSRYWGAPTNHRARPAAAAAPNIAHRRAH